MSKASPQSTRIAIASLLAATALLPAGAIGAHVWEEQELAFTATRTFTNAYTEAVVWVDLDRTQLQEADLWLLGWRPDFSGTAPGNGAGDLELEERCESGR